MSSWGSFDIFWGEIQAVSKLLRPADQLQQGTNRNSTFLIPPSPPSTGCLFPLSPLYNVFPHCQRARLVVELEVEATGVADWSSSGVSSPEAGTGSETIGATGVCIDHKLALQLCSMGLLQSRHEEQVMRRKVKSSWPSTNPSSLLPTSHRPSVR